MIPVYAPKFRRAPLSAVMAVAIFAVPTTGVFAQTRASTTITLNPSKDNTLIENGSGALSNGAGQNIYVGRINRSSGSIRRAVLAFDVSSMPSGATAESVSLSLNRSRSRSGGQTINVHKLTADWGEGSSASFGGSGALSLKRRDMGPPVFPLDVVVICADGHRRAGLGGCIRNQFRMVIERQRVVSTNGEKVRLREYSVSSNRPVLSITYSVPDPTPTPSPTPTPTRTPTPTPMPPPSTDSNAHTGAGA